MAFVLELGGTDRSTYYMNKSFSLRETLGSRSTAGFKLFDAAGTLSVPIGTDFKLTIDDAVVFWGSVESVLKEFKSYDQSGTGMWLQVRCVDHTQILDRHLIARAFQRDGGMTYGDIVKTIIRETLSADGIVEGQIQNGGSTTLVTFNHETATNVLSKLAEAVGYVFYVDYNKQLHFRDRINVEAPFNIGPGNLNYRKLTVKETRSQYRNRQFLRGGMQVSPNYRIEVFAGDSTDRTFTVSQPIGAEPIIEVFRQAPARGQAVGGWERQTVAIEAEEGTAQWTWSQNEKEVTQDDSEPILTTLYYGAPSEEIEALQAQDWDFFPLTTMNDFVRVIYQPMVRILARSEDSTEIASRAAAEGGSGVYEQIVDDSRVEDADFARERATGLLSRFGRIPTIANITTDHAGLRAGQLQTINLSKEGLSDGSYLIESIAAKDRGDFTLRYTYKALDGEAIGGWQDFFRQLIERGKDLIITEGEVVMMFRATTDTITVADNLPTPATSNTLGSYTTDAYTVCLVDGGSQVGSSYPAPFTYAETIIDAGPSLYYRLDEVSNQTNVAEDQNVSLADSSLTANTGSGSLLVAGLSPGAVGEDPVDFFEESVPSLGNAPGGRNRVGWNFGIGDNIPDWWNGAIGGRLHRDPHIGTYRHRYFAAQPQPATHPPGSFAPQSQFPSICVGFPNFGSAFAPRIMVPYSVLNGQADMSVEFWVETATTSHEMNLVNASRAAILDEFRLVLDENTTPTMPNTDSISLHYYDVTASAVRTVTWDGMTIRPINAIQGLTPFINKGFFIHIAIVRNQADQLFELFINGAGVGIKTSNSAGARIRMENLDIEENGIAIGQKFDTTIGAFDGAYGYEGKLDEFAIFPRVLRDSEIADHSISKRKRYYVGSRIPADGEPTYTAL